MIERVYIVCGYQQYGKSWIVGVYNHKGIAETVCEECNDVIGAVEEDKHFLVSEYEIRGN